MTQQLQSIHIHLCLLYNAVYDRKKTNPMTKEIVFPLSHHPKYLVPVDHHFVKFPPIKHGKENES